MRPHIFSAAIFFVAFVFGPLRQLEFLSKMPGDIVDARLNNYFLENIFQYLSGHAASLINLSFFYPYPYVSGFSDNLFGAAPIYILARLFSFTPEQSFQFWFIMGYGANFIAALCALRLFGQSREASALGALLFTFGLPASAQMGHAQLQYRFGLALAIAYFHQFLVGLSWRSLVYSAFWLFWQFLCSIYLGFFAALFMGSMVVFFGLCASLDRNGSLSPSIVVSKFIGSFVALKCASKIKLLIVSLALFIVLLALFYPYLKVTALYHFSRSWAEVSAMLPRMGSYLLADHALLWAGICEKIKGVPIRWEQQLFIGFVPIIIIFAALLNMKKAFSPQAPVFWVSASLAALVAITLDVNDESLWRLVFALPLFSAIRAVSRIILLFLFPVSLFVAVSVDFLIKIKTCSKKYLLTLISIPMLIEVSAVSATTSVKSDWLSRLNKQEVRLPKNISEHSILFFSQKSTSFESEELDAMLVAQRISLPTINGYSGALPHHFRAAYGQDCSEFPRRIILYLDFIGQAQNTDAYAQLARRVTPIGFKGCQESWASQPPMTIASRPLEREELSQLSLAVAPKGLDTDPGYLRVRIFNHGSKNISAISGVDQPVRLAWRYIGVDGVPQGGWMDPRPDLPAGGLPQGYRQDLPGDIPPGGYIDVLAPMAEKAILEGAAAEFTIVQEATLWGFSLQKDTNVWAHELGVTPLRVDRVSQ